MPAHPAPGQSFAPSRQGEFRGLRAYRHGDDPRDIHWRSSARRGIPLVREKEDEETREATVVLDNEPGAAADPAAFERAVSEAAGLCVELARRGFSVGLAVRGGEVRPAVGGAQTERILRALAVIAPDAGPLPPVRAGTVVRIRPGAAPALEAARARRRAQPRGCGAHEVRGGAQAGDLPAGAVGAGRRREHPRARAGERARVRRRRLPLSFHVESGSRVALALDRAAAVVRVAALALFAAIAWRLWRHLPDPDVGPAFDLLLALLGYKLFFRRIHRDYVHVAALTFLLVLVASTIAHSFVFVATFAIYVVVAVWALILFHLRREMEENYLIKHSAQAPSQKVGVGRILGIAARRGRDFFVATAGMAAVGLRRRGRDLHAGPARRRRLRGRRHAHVGQRGRLRRRDRDRALRNAHARTGATSCCARRCPTCSRATTMTRAASAADELYFRGAAYDGYEGGRWVHSHKPELRTIVERRRRAIS